MLYCQFVQVQARTGIKLLLIELVISLVFSIVYEFSASSRVLFIKILETKFKCAQIKQNGRSFSRINF